MPYPLLNIEFAVLTACIAGLVLLLRRKSMLRQRPLRLTRQWALVAVCMTITAVIFTLTNPPRIIWVWSCAAALAGVALGVLRASKVHIAISEDGALLQKTSPATLVFLFGLLILRSITKVVILEVTEADMHALDLAFVALATGMIAGLRMALTFRARSARRSAQAAMAGSYGEPPVRA